MIGWAGGRIDGWIKRERWVEDSLVLKREELKMREWVDRIMR